MNGLELFCQEVFAGLSRADQRHTAETYVHGLLHCTGRKSIRRIAEVARRRNERSLQQFINQSPWDSDLVRQRLAARLLRSLRPTAWAMGEVAFPKHGRHSAAVDRQYVHSLGRVVNCQLAISVMLVSEQVGVPVNWRLLVPEGWGTDDERRASVRMPKREHPRPYWQYHIEALDDIAFEWGMPAAPVLVNARHPGGADDFFLALELRGQDYLAEVGLNLVVQSDRLRHGGAVGNLLGQLGGLARETVEWQVDGHGGVLRSQFLRVAVRPAPPRGEAEQLSSAEPVRMLVAEWPVHRPRPRRLWLTNLVDIPLPDLVALAMRRDSTGKQIEQLAAQFGLRDYEGRTFPGWHHHVTLVSVACGYHALANHPRAEIAPDPRPAAARTGQRALSRRSPGDVPIGHARPAARI